MSLMDSLNPSERLLVLAGLRLLQDAKADALKHLRSQGGSADLRVSLDRGVAAVSRLADRFERVDRCASQRLARSAEPSRKPVARSSTAEL